MHIQGLPNLPNHATAHVLSCSLEALHRSPCKAWPHCRYCFIDKSLVLQQSTDVRSAKPLSGVANSHFFDGHPHHTHQLLKFSPAFVRAAGLACDFPTKTPSVDGNRNLVSAPNRHTRSKGSNISSTFLNSSYACLSCCVCGV